MKIGDYVRIKTLSGQGGISKLEKIDDICITDNGAVDKNNIIKSSPNIIDLIEVGDYVNGIYIEGNNGKYLETLDVDGENSWLGHIEYLRIYANEIKTIVTKEQFERMEYKVGADKE